MHAPIECCRKEFPATFRCGSVAPRNLGSARANTMSQAAADAVFVGPLDPKELLENLLIKPRTAAANVIKVNDETRSAKHAILHPFQQLESHVPIVPTKGRRQSLDRSVDHFARAVAKRHAPIFANRSNVNTAAPIAGQEDKSQFG